MQLSNPLVQSALLALGLFLSLIVAQFAGRAIGRWRAGVRAGEKKSGSSTAVDGAVFALLGLLLAFTFTGADARFQHRRDLVIEQVNALGTAWLRIDLLTAADQPPIRDLFRRYVDQLRRVAVQSWDPQALARTIEDTVELQDEIWALAVAAVERDGRPQVATLLLPALNQSFDLSNSRLAAARIHVHPQVLWFLFGIAILSGIVAGRAQSATPRPDLFHTLIFAGLISATLYFILDLDYPRLGFIRLDSVDIMMDELRASLGEVPAPSDLGSSASP
ncbi:DUF4239 domain-containing protein [Thioalkalicoccus limnaeus]|uniref:DUF4239 domain-containing protein n=1 Tax=Thioalkalicoccus limnaeus TaxID=120681 RepID=A0ABV4BHN8_9GAMM